MNVYLFHSFLFHVIVIMIVLKFNFSTKTLTKKYYIDFISSKPQVVTRGFDNNTQIDKQKSSNNTKEVETQKQQIDKKETKTTKQEYKQIEDPDYLYKNSEVIKPSMANEESSILNEINNKYTNSNTTQELTGSGGIKTDTDFPYPWYITKLRAKLWDNWQTQNIISQNISAIVKFRIYPNGEIRDVNIEKKSGNRLFDHSVINTINSIKNVDPLPSDFSEDYLTVYVEFKAVQ